MLKLDMSTESECCEMGLSSFDIINSSCNFGYFCGALDRNSRSDRWGGDLNSLFLEAAGRRVDGGLDELPL